MSWKFSHTQNS